MKRLIVLARFRLIRWLVGSDGCAMNFNVIDEGGKLLARRSGEGRILFLANTNIAPPSKERPKPWLVYSA